MAGTLYGVLLRLWNRMNTLPTINRLPPEILLYIFNITCLGSDSYRGYVSCTNRLKTSIRPPQLTITHVCRAWRDLALGASTLWAHIDFYNYHLLELFLSRSGSTALQLHVGNKRPDELLRGHVDRLRRLDISVVNYYDKTFIPMLLDFHAPALECLTMVARNGYPSSSGDITMMLFKERTLNLKALALDNIGWWTPENFFPCLTHLHLSSIGGNAEAPHEASYLATFLANTPALQYLHVKGVTSGALAARPKRDGWRASLPSLRALTCWGSPLQLNSSLLELSLLLTAKEQDGQDISGPEDVPRGVYAALSGYDPSTCVPHLESLKLETLCTDSAILCSSDLLSMAAMRAQHGRPLQSLIVNTSSQSAHCLDPFSRELAQVREHVAGTVELRPEAARSNYGLPVKFKVPEAERWWDLPDAIRPRSRKSRRPTNL
ncbi:hypothetical protein C8Q73DRAFT_792748 [Cubamyces lactineus]|nr:hypothetical protein C8Q73DRAFT_792748 [Cubamyces lactineus]